MPIRCSLPRGAGRSLLTPSSAPDDQAKRDHQRSPAEWEGPLVSRMRNGGSHLTDLAEAVPRLTETKVCPIRCDRYAGEGEVALVQGCQATLDRLEGRLLL